MGNTDSYYKKTIKYEYRGHPLQFRVSQSLFSSNDIDLGTRRLLRTLTDEKINVFDKALDLGCGYGPLGIALKIINPTGKVHMLDKDALALEYSRQNAKLNNTGDLKIYGGLGFDDVEEKDFDLIVSNIPAKVGENVLSHLLLDSEFYLQPKGRVIIVVIDAIKEFVANVLVNNPNIKILLTKSWLGHTVFHYKFTSTKKAASKPNSTAFEKGAYDRDVKDFTFEPSSISIKTTFNLPEFDTLGYDTELLRDKLKILEGRNVESVMVFNPGQGYIPVYISKLINAKRIYLVDRDLQSLRISRENLIDNGYLAKNIMTSHQVGISGKEKFEFVIGVLPEKDGPIVHAMFVRQAVPQLVNSGLFVISSSSTAITRIQTFVHKEKLFNMLGEKRSKGKAVLILKSK